MKNIYGILVFTITIVVQNLWSFQELKTYKKYEVPYYSDETWVIFDIDNTIIHSQTYFGSVEWAELLKKDFIKSGMQELEANEKQHQIFAQAQKHIDTQIVEVELLRVLKQFKERGYKIFALTARNPNLMAETFKQLKYNGLSFVSTAPQFNDIQNSGLSYQDGVVFAKGSDKGKIFEKLYSHAIAKPTNLIFFDDKDYNVIAMERALETLKTSGIKLQFEAIRYGGVDWRVEQISYPVAVTSYLLWTINMSDDWYLRPNSIKMETNLYQITQDKDRAARVYAYQKYSMASQVSCQDDNLLFTCKLSFCDDEYGPSSCTYDTLKLTLTYDKEYQFYRLQSYE